MNLVKIYLKKKDSIVNHDPFVNDSRIPEFKLFNIAIRDKKYNVDIDFEVSFFTDYSK